MLYVGISLRALNRLGQHRNHSAWFSSIARVEMEHYPSRPEVCEAERIAIADENPKHNIVRAMPKSRKKTKYGKPIYDDDPLSLPELSRGDILRRYVNFSLMYSVTDVANHLGMKDNEVADLVDTGVLGHVRVPWNRGKAGYRVRITGWQLIDYVELLQAEADARTVPTNRANLS